jgi:hypothetical protein
MPSERIQEILAGGVTPRRRKGALGTWRARALHWTGHRTGNPGPRHVGGRRREESSTLGRRNGPGWIGPVQMTALLLDM